MFDCFLVDFVVVIVVCFVFFLLFFIFYFLVVVLIVVSVVVVIVDIVLRAGRRFIDDMGIFFSHSRLKISRKCYFLLGN